MKKKLFLSLFCLLLLISLLCSCSKAAPDRFGDMYDNEYAGGAPEAPDKDMAGSNADIISSENTDNQKLIKTVTMTLETLEFDAFIEKMNSALSSAEGYVENSSMSKSSYSSLRTGSYTLRIPASNLDVFTEALKGEANLLNYNETATDVSLTYADLEGRLSSLRAEQTALNAMLEKAETVSECITIQDRLYRVRGEIESLEGQLRVLASKISYSTVTVTLREVQQVTVDETKLTIWEEIGMRFSQTASDVGDYLRNMFVGIVSGLPVLLAIIVTILVVLTPPALLVLIIILIVKGSKKRKAKKQALTSGQANSQNSNK